MPNDALRVAIGILLSTTLLLVGWEVRVNPKLKLMGWVLVALGILGLMEILVFIADY
jgi:hypothetical protein